MEYTAAMLRFSCHKIRLLVLFLVGRARRGEEVLPEHLSDPAPTLPEQLIADEEKRRLYAAIAQLPVLQRSILLDSVYFGLTDAEIADTHHITRENVRQHRSRAKRRLRKLLGEEDPS